MSVGERKYSKYQKELIGRYYENLDNIMLQKLGELVTELYLAQGQAKQDRLWQKAHKAMLKLGIRKPIVDHIMQKRSVEILAKNLQDWLRQSKKK